MEDSALDAWSTLAVAFNSGAAIVKEPLNDENYKEWRACMEGYLVDKDLWCVVENGHTEPSNSESAATATDRIVADAYDQSNNNDSFEVTGRTENFDDCKRKNKLAFHAIWISCEEQAADLIWDLSSATASSPLPYDVGLVFTLSLRRLPRD